jgi:hypothetical protein
MSKIKLIYSSTTHPCLTQGFVRELMDEYVDIVEYDPTKVYSPLDTIILQTHVGVLQPQPWHTHLIEQGFKTVVDHLWDSDVDTPSQIKNNTLILRNGNWLWYRESMHYQSMGYDQYRPQRNYQHAFFMPINKAREHKDLVLERIAPVLEQGLYSYADRGRKLPNDFDREQQGYWLYYFNPEWYNSSCFSVVVESYMRSMAWHRNPEVPNYKTEISEKSFKPIAYYHPFITFGSVDTMKYLQREGFETFDNLWNESYDSIINDDQRHQAVADTVLYAVKEYNQNNLKFDRLTEQKLAHNHARFFDTALVKQRVQDEIIRDVLSYINS